MLKLIKKSAKSIFRMYKHTFLYSLTIIKITYKGICDIYKFEKESKTDE